LPRRLGYATMEADMAAHAKRVEIASEDRAELERLARSRAGE